MKKLEKPILADGEVTGHAHRLGAGDVFEQENGVKVFDLAQGTDLMHEEHGVIHLPPGEYLSDQVREVDHFAEDEEERRARD